ncbi:MAG: phage tail sheath family protein [Desulfobulbus sp.]|nr:phage tail sheath family protein [Desulfobulbus sp.]
MEGYLPEDVSNTPLKDFRDSIGINNLSYGAAYYPWIVTGYTCDIGFRQLAFFDAAAPATRITDLTPYANNEKEEALTAAITAALADTDACCDIAGADRLRLRAEGSNYLRARLADYEADIGRNSALTSNMTGYLNVLADVAAAFAKAEASAQTDSGFAKEVALLKKDAGLMEALIGLVAIEKNPATIANTEAARDAARVNALYSPLAPAWLDNTAIDDIEADTTSFANNRAGRLEIISALAPHVSRILSSYDRLCDAALYYEREGNDALFAGHAFFSGVRDMLIRTMRTVPPSGTVAGIYAGVDSTRGVWKAPANISINAIIGPAVSLDNKDQEDLNVHTSGKSINAIRAFTGRGSLVWGARTLAGNDNEWRYVPVRRFYIMAEESIKKATEPFVFEPNDANTWVKVRAMIENFLILQWRAGALQGAKPEEAFYVHVGLNETMTALDILEGRMIVEIGMAVVRPAEFIILRFSHLMQSGQG